MVEQSRLANVSVARLAQEYGINANQIFAWRRAYDEGRLDAPCASSLVDVQITPAEDRALASQPVEHSVGALTITTGAEVMAVTVDVNPSLLRPALKVLMAR